MTATATQPPAAIAATSALVAAMIALTAAIVALTAAFTPATVALAAARQLLPWLRLWRLVQLSAMLSP